MINSTCEYEHLIEQLYTEMYDQLYAYAIGALGESDVAEEAVQEVFRIACSRSDKLCESENPRGWLVNALKNVVRNFRRKQRKSDKLVAELIAIEDISAEAPLSEVETDIAYLERLDEDEARLLRMVIFENRTNAEAAEEFGITLEACKKRVQRTKRKLKTLIENENTK